MFEVFELEKFYKQREQPLQLGNRFEIERKTNVTIVRCGESFSVLYTFPFNGP